MKSPSRILSFGQWQARELRLRDVLLLATIVVGLQLYAAKINSAACAAFATNQQPVCPQRPSSAATDALQPAAAAAWGLAERLGCGCAHAPWWLHNNKPEGGLHKALHTLAALLVQAFNTALQLLFRLYALGWVVGCPLMFGLPVVIALYLALLLLPIPYWTLSSAAQPQHRSTSRPSSSGNGGSSSGVQVHTNRRPQPHQQHRHWVTRVTRWELRWRSRDWYWEVPNARLLLVVSFRAALCILPPLSVGVLRPAPHLLPLNGYLQWPIFVQYAWRGWVGFLQLLPWRLQLVMCACETLGALHMTAAAHPSHMTRGSGLLALHLACSVLCFAVPMAASVIWEGVARKQYARYKAEAEALQAVDTRKGCDKAAAQGWPCAGKAGDGKQQTSPGSGSSRGRATPRKSSPTWEEGSDATRSTVFRHSSSSNFSTSDASLLQSSIVTQQPPQVGRLPEAPAAAAAASAPAAGVADNIADLRAQLLPRLTRVVGRQAAEHILSVPEPAHDTMELQAPGAYVAHSELTPVSIKVDNSHAELESVAPLLLGTLEEALLITQGTEDLPDSSQQQRQGQQQQQQQRVLGSINDIALQSICFQGCVQLLASVYQPQPAPASNPQQVDPSRAPGYSEAAVAQRLVQLMQARAAAAAQQPGGQGGSLGPLLGVVVGASNLHPPQAPQGSGRADASKQAPQRIRLLWQDIPALTAGAGNQQQPVLILDLEDVLPAIMAGAAEQDPVAVSSSRSTSSSSLVGCWARLMIFSNKEVLFDQLLQLQAAIRLSLPPLRAGAYHLAVLQHDGKPPAPHQSQVPAQQQQQQQQQKEEGQQQQEQQQEQGQAGSRAVIPTTTHSSAGTDPATPVLLQPLVVLPAGPAGELQQLWNAGCQRLWTAQRPAAAAAPGPVAPTQVAPSSRGGGRRCSDSAASVQARHSLVQTAAMYSSSGSSSSSSNNSCEPEPSPMRAVQVRPDGTWLALSSTPVAPQTLLAQRHLVLAWQHMMASLLQDIAYLLTWAEGSTLAGPTVYPTSQGLQDETSASSTSGAGGSSVQQRRSPATAAAAAGGGGGGEGGGGTQGEAGGALDAAASGAGEPLDGAQSELLQLQVVLQPLLHYLTTHDLWSLTEYLVGKLLQRQQQLLRQVLQGPAAAAQGWGPTGHSLGAPEPLAGVPRSDVQPQPDAASAPAAAAAAAGAAAWSSHEGAWSQPSSCNSGYGSDNDSDTPVKPSSSSCSRQVADLAGTSTSRSSKWVGQPTGLRKRGPVAKEYSDAWDEPAPAAEPSPEDLLEAAQAQSEAGRWQQHPVRQLLLGFAHPGLETAYLQYVARLSGAPDALGNLVILLVAFIPGLGLDIPALAAAMGWRAALWRQWHDVLWLALFVLPSMVALCIRPWLMHGRRREHARLVIELLFSAMFVVPVLGLMSEASTHTLCMAMVPYGWRNFAIILDVSIFRPLSRQVRLQTYLPTGILEAALQILYQHVRCGHGLLLSAARYAIILPVATWCCAALERRRRWMFLQHKLAQHAGALQSRED